MIYDKIDNYSHYYRASAWTKVFTFLKQIDSSWTDGEYPIDGERIFARVMSYHPKKKEDAVLESHLVYADIQAVLIGAEGMVCEPCLQLTPHSPYDEQRDVLFYHSPQIPTLSFQAQVGSFALFLPQDAHQTQLQMGASPEMIKKVVIKIKHQLLLKK